MSVGTRALLCCVLLAGFLAWFVVRCALRVACCVAFVRCCLLIDACVFLTRFVCWLSCVACGSVLCVVVCGCCLFSD